MKVKYLLELICFKTLLELAVFIFIYGSTINGPKYKLLQLDSNLFITYKNNAESIIRIVIKILKLGFRILHNYGTI